MNLFNPENKFWMFIAKVADVALMSLLWFIACLPVFTIGAATVSFYAFTQRQVKDTEGTVFKSFFSEMKRKFLKSTAIFGVEIVTGGILAANLWAAVHFFLLRTGGVTGVTMFAFALCGCLLFAAMAMYSFPLMARHDFGVKKTISDSFILAMGNLPATVTLLVLVAALLAGLYFLPVFSFILFGLYFFVSSYVFDAVFRKYEEPKATS